MIKSYTEQNISRKTPCAALKTYKYSGLMYNRVTTEKLESGAALK